MPFGNKKNILENLFSIATIKKYHPPENREFNYFGHFTKLEIAYFNGKKYFQFLLS